MSDDLRARAQQAVASVQHTLLCPANAPVSEEGTIHNPGPCLCDRDARLAAGLAAVFGRIMPTMAREEAWAAFTRAAAL